MRDILDVIHKTIYQFFDVCGDDEEVSISDKDKLLLEVNKAICDNLKALEQEPCEMTIGKVIDYIINFYYQAKDDPAIHKPFAWALYQTWRLVDEYERKDGEQNEQS